jgi:hypothetical protein
MWRVSITSAGRFQCARSHRTRREPAVLKHADAEIIDKGVVGLVLTMMNSRWRAPFAILVFEPFRRHETDPSKPALHTITPNF